MQVADWMNREVVAVDADASVETALRLILAKRVHRLPVFEGARLVGILTEGDCLRKAKTGDSVRKVMSSPAVTIRPDQSVEEAALLLLGHEVGGLPVVRNDAVIGFITKSDVLHAFLHLRGKGPLDIAAAVIRAEDGPDAA